MSKYQTSFRLMDAETSIPVTIFYEYRKAYLSPGRQEPDEPAHCEITDIVAMTGDGAHSLAWIVDEMNADEELQSTLLEYEQDLADDAAERAAEERAAEERAEREDIRHD